MDKNLNYKALHVKIYYMHKYGKTTKLGVLN